VKVVLGDFTRSSLEHRFGSDLEAGAQAAMRHYARRLDSPRRPAAFPPSLGDWSGIAASGAELELPVAPRVEAALTEEAGRLGVPVERIACCAVLLYLADLDAASADRSEAAAEESGAIQRYGGDAACEKGSGSARGRRGSQGVDPPSRGEWSRGTRARARSGGGPGGG
jgi:hypothetical protein